MIEEQAQGNLLGQRTRHERQSNKVQDNQRNGIRNYRHQQEQNTVQNLPCRNQSLRSSEQNLQRPIQPANLRNLDDTSSKQELLRDCRIGRNKMETLNISTTDTAKLIRRDLKSNFKDIQFSVTCDKYAGGATIWVTFEKESGVTAEAVLKLIGKYEGQRFDGSTDSTEYITSELDGQPVRFGPHFIMVQAS
jgi:hypothetical protein